MNKTALTAIRLAVVAFLFSFYTFISPAGETLKGYVPPVQSSSGFTQSLSASSTLAASSFCSPASIQYLGSSGAVTSTLAAATSTFASCGTLDNFGASVSGLLGNDSTNTVNFGPGTGDVFKCQTAGAGTSTVSGTCTSTGFSILASSTVQYTVFFDSSSSTLIFAVGNNFK